MLKRGVVWLEIINRIESARDFIHWFPPNYKVDYSDWFKLHIIGPLIMS